MFISVHKTSQGVQIIFDPRISDGPVRVEVSSVTTQAELVEHETGAISLILREKITEVFGAENLILTKKGTA